MQQVATNIRFDQSEYQELKKLALIEGKSLAALIREAAHSYRRQKLNHPSHRQALLKLITQATVKIDVPVTELVKENRKFE